MPIWDKFQWNNYTNLDVIVAARSFDSRNYPNKGSIKLINAWHAGVPALLTPELGFLAERKTELDFIIIHSLEEAIEAVRRLKSSPELYQKMVENGYERAKEHTIETTLNQWMSFFKDVAFPTYDQWSALSQFEKRWLFSQRYLAFKYDRFKHKINNLGKSKA
jgi:hypothetical protein